jgi:hypothetical protein
MTRIERASHWLANVNTATTARQHDVDSLLPDNEGK